jgi:hypothetical protein
VVISYVPSSCIRGSSPGINWIAWLVTRSAANYCSWLTSVMRPARSIRPYLGAIRARHPDSAPGRDRGRRICCSVRRYSRPHVEACGLGGMDDSLATIASVIR